ncbi:general substrate transporter [Auriculariales sp. MPI-PUGE-AT-0066]|nr:general substrate transporter [Auriculariales sp. MPI-PUGE-AT-0066]
MPLSPKWYTWLCGLFAALGSVTFGYDLGIIASVLPSTNFKETVGHPNSTQEGFIVSMLLLGAFSSNIYVGTLADTVGRRKAIIAGCIIFLIGGTIQTAAQGLSWMWGGRFLAGMGIGMLAMLAPLYQSEIAHPSIRGRLTTLQQFMLGIGAFIASFIGYGCFNGSNGGSTSWSWRVPLAIQMIPAVPLAFFILALPESPRYLAMKGDEQGCLSTLARLHANGDENDTFVQAEYTEIIAQLRLERSAGSWSQLFGSASNRRRLLLGIALQFSVQMTGVSCIQYYSPQIFASIGIDASTTLGLQSGNSVIALIGEALCVLFIDKLGRRWPLISANALSGLTFVIGTAIIAEFPADTNNHHASRAFVSMTWLFNLAFSAAIGPLSWAIPVEMFNSATRAKATAITSSAAWISNFMIAQVTPIAFANVGWRYYLVFAICGFSNAIFFWAFMPETRGIPLEEIDEYFERTPIFIPTSSGYVPDAHSRENELRAGQVRHGNAETDIEKGSVHHEDLKA